MGGNSENAMAGVNKKFLFTLFPQSANIHTKTAGNVELSCSPDSLFVTFISASKSEIKNGVLNITDFNTSPYQKSNQPLSLTLKTARKIGNKKFLLSIPLRNIPPRVIIETKANINSETNANSFISRVGFSKKDYSFIPIPSGLTTDEVSAKTALTSWVPVTDAFRYEVLCREADSSTWITGTIMAPGNQRPFVNLKPATKYEFKVQAYTRKEKVDSTGYSALFTFVTARQSAIQPAANINRNRDMVTSLRVDTDTAGTIPKIRVRIPR
jgi:hypothetical protein